jgi:hypothetical protein
MGGWKVVHRWLKGTLPPFHVDIKKWMQKPLFYMGWFSLFPYPTLSQRGWELVPRLGMYQLLNILAHGSIKYFLKNSYKYDTNIASF